MTAQHVSDDPLLLAYRLLLRIARENKPQRCAAAAETPPGAQKKAAGAPHPAAAPVTSTVTTAEPCSRLEDGHGR